MPEDNDKKQLDEESGDDSAELDFNLFEDGEDSREQSAEPSGIRNSDSEKPTSASAIKGDLPRSMSDLDGPDTLINLTPGHFELVITDDIDDTTEIIANTDFHAFFIKDNSARECLDEYGSAIAGLFHDTTPAKNHQFKPQGKSRIFPPLVERLRQKAADTRVIFTTRKNGAAIQALRNRIFAEQICKSLKLSNHDKDLIIDAFIVHTLAKLGFSQNPQRCRRKTDDKSLRPPDNFGENHTAIDILRSMYRSLKPGDIEQASLEVMGGNILTAVDLYSDTIRDEKFPSEKTLENIIAAFRKLSGKLILDEIVEAFAAILRGELSRAHEAEKSARIIIFSDHSDYIYALKVRLRNEGLKAITLESLESLPGLCQRIKPDLLILRFHSPAAVVSKAMQYLSLSGVNFSETPTFLMVKNSILPRLAGMLDIGIEDILDLDIDLDVLLPKIKRMQKGPESSANRMHHPNGKQSGSRGNLSEMNIIDLIQALGPSRRTSKITVSHDGGAGEALVIYLDRGNISFAELGELKGEAAIHKALTWVGGTWIVEQVTEDQLPEPNNDLPNEAILMEGCRLMDENSK